jgi:hypothetical protein
MNGKTIRICREIEFQKISFKLSDFISPVLGIATLFTFLPALFYGCCRPELQYQNTSTCQIRLTPVKSPECQRRLDIFVFRDDMLQKLDCYQRIDEPDNWDGNIVSTYGDRIMAICANCSLPMEYWTEVNSFHSLKRLTYNLEDEQIGFPFMSGTIRTSAGHESRMKDMQLRPLFSEISVRSIVCDFSGKPYAGEELTDVSFYLTNVNAECGILADGQILPGRIVNAGRRRTEDLEAFSDPSLISYDFPGTIGNSIVMPDINFRCYPNNSSEESAGSPFTRLVIEGKIEGHTYYWPIDINRDGSGDGIGRNRRYVYDIEIRRKGSTDPDIPVITDDIIISLKTEEWKEKEEYEVLF